MELFLHNISTQHARAALRMPGGARWFDVPSAGSVAVDLSEHDAQLFVAENNLPLAGALVLRLGGLWPPVPASLLRSLGLSGLAYSVPACE